MDSLSTVACTVGVVAAGVQVNFGERVRELRKKQGLAQEAFAHVCVSIGRKCVVPAGPMKLNMDDL